jgi:hypothetical protein
VRIQDLVEFAARRPCSRFGGHAQIGSDKIRAENHFHSGSLHFS